MLQCVAVLCGVLQCVAACCIALDGDEDEGDEDLDFTNRPTTEKKGFLGRVYDGFFGKTTTDQKDLDEELLKKHKKKTDSYEKIFEKFTEDEEELLKEFEKSDYNILGVSVDTSDQEIRSAYRTLAKQTHPDKNSSPTALEDFKILVNAYDSIKQSRGFSGGSTNKNLTFEEAEQMFKNEFNVSAKDI